MIQRSYNLPSCNLLIEGISTGGDNLSILTNFDCRFSHQTESIVGGLELLSNLIKVVGAYTQSLQSLNKKNAVAMPEHQVKLESEGQHLHVLSMSMSEGNEQSSQDLKIKLNTIQLFDLMENLDRLCCDPLTLPDLKLATDIADQRSQSQLNRQTIPAIAGVFSLAIATTVLYFMPVPKPSPKPAQTVPVQTSPLPTPSVPPTPSSIPETPSSN
jgi:hypothetical protein